MGRLKEVCTQCGKSYGEGTTFCPADGTELMSVMADPLIGVVLPRRYRILEPLGRGSMSVVYKGVYEPLDRPVAIKMLKSHLVSDPHQAKRFQREIKTAGSLNHPNIVGILDFGVTEQGVPYLIMDYLDGKSLSEVLEAEERISVSRCIRMFSQAADALAYAHREGVIHRDIKPSNILVMNSADEKDLIKIVDFGIAKIQAPGINMGGQNSANGLTSANEVLGTPLYMSPEQSQGRELDGRSDIYSLGCVMYHAITGKPPFVGDTPLDTIRLQISAIPAPIETVRPDLYIPDRLVAAVTKALQKDPRNRYQRMEYVKNELDSQVMRPDSSSVSIRTRRPDESHKMPAVTDEKPELSMRLPIICAALAVVFTIGVVGWGFITDVGKKPAVIKVDLPIPSDDNWHKATLAGQAAFNDGRYADAEESYNEALAEAKKFKQPDPRMATALNNLAYVYYAEDRLDDAQKACNRSLDILKSANPKDPAIADTLSNLSRIYCATGDYDQAETAGKQALAMRQKYLGPTHHDVALSLQGLAELDCKRGNYKKAGEVLNQALSIAEKSLGAENSDVASIEHDLGMVYEKQGKYPAAEELFNTALGIREKALGVQNPAVADTLCALGTLNFNLKKDAAAEKMFNTALTIRQKIFGQDSSRTAEVYSCLAILYDNDKKFPQAEECYRKAVEIRQKLWGPDSPRLVRSLEHLTKFLREHNQANGADVYDTQIKHIQENHA